MERGKDEKKNRHFCYGQMEVVAMWEPRLVAVGFHSLFIFRFHIK